jgi:hypothetical protein
MRRLASQRVLTADLVELRSPSYQLLNPGRTLLNKDLDRRFAAQSFSGPQRIFSMHGNVILFRSYGDAALCINGAAFGRASFGENQYVTPEAQPDRRSEARDAAPDYEKIRRCPKRHTCLSIGRTLAALPPRCHPERRVAVHAAQGKVLMTH